MSSSFRMSTNPSNFCNWYRYWGRRNARFRRLHQCGILSRASSCPSEEDLPKSVPKPRIRIAHDQAEARSFTPPGCRCSCHAHRRKPSCCPRTPWSSSGRSRCWACCRRSSWRRWRRWRTERQTSGHRHDGCERPRRRCWRHDHRCPRRAGARWLQPARRPSARRWRRNPGPSWRGRESWNGTCASPWG